MDVNYGQQQIRTLENLKYGGWYADQCVTQR